MVLDLYEHMCASVCDCMHISAYLKISPLGVAMLLFSLHYTPEDIGRKQEF